MLHEVTIFDEQDGKWVTGLVCDIKERESFKLVDDKGNLIGKYDFSLIKHLYDGLQK